MAAALLTTQGHVATMQNVPLVTSFWDANLQAHSGHFWSQATTAWMPFIEMSPQVCAALDARRTDGGAEEAPRRSSGAVRGFSARSNSSSSSSSSSTSASVTQEKQRHHRRRRRHRAPKAPAASLRQQRERSAPRLGVRGTSRCAVGRSRWGLRAGVAPRSSFARGCSTKASGAKRFHGGSFPSRAGAASGAVRRRRTTRGTAECRK